METDRIILTNQVSMLPPSLLVSIILRERERQRNKDKERQRAKDKDRDREKRRQSQRETQREGDRETQSKAPEQSFAGWDTPAG